MANPRKFSDKLEIIRRKEEEANAAFVKIMREVSDARKGGPTTPHSHLGPHQNTWLHPTNEFMKIRQKYKGGSLPNVNLSPNPPMIQNVYAPMNDMYGQQQQHYIGMNPTHIRRSMEPPSGPIFPSKSKARSYTVTAPYRNNLHPQPSVIAEQNDSPSIWRRTFSDSAIQQTLQQPPKTNSHESSSTLSRPNGPQVIQTQGPQIDTNDHISYPNSPPVGMSYNESTSNKSHVQMQANTNSLPDLSNLSIPSPIQNPIDVEQEGENNSSQQEPSNPFQIPYRVPPRRAIGKQIYTRQMSSNPDVLESLQREQKLHLNLYGMNTDKNEINLPGVNSSVSAPLSPVTPPPYYWNSTPMSPLATGDLMQQQQHISAPTDLQQQLQQFQIHNESNGNNGLVNPPPYPYMNEQENFNYFNNAYNKQNICRINSGPAQLSTNSSRAMCDRQLDSALMRVKNQVGSELSEADLRSVQVALDPLDFDDVQILSGENTELVDQSAEEEFRLERASYH